MHNLSSEPGPNSYGSTSWETGSPSQTNEGRNNNQELIQKANSLSCVLIFKFYKVKLDEYNRCICPFKSHKGGRETTASFNFYPDTNSFYCFGCTLSGGPVNFAAEVERCSKIQAALKIIKLFGEDISDDYVQSSNLEERLEIMLSFSALIREFRFNHKTEKAFEYVEAACKKYDELNLKHDLDNAALKRLVEQLEAYIKLFDLSEYG